MTEEIPTPESSQPRNWLGWALLVVLFGLLITSVVAGTFERDKQDSTEPRDHTSVVQGIKLHLVTRYTSVVATKPSSDLKTYIAELRSDAKTDPEAAKLLVAAQTEDGGAPDGEALDLLNRSPSTKAFAVLYLPRSSSAEIRESLDKIQPSSLVNKLARFHARKRLGDPSPESELSIRTEFLKLTLFGAVIVGLMLLGPAAWVVFLLLKSSGNLKPKGFPLANISLKEADDLALLGAIIFGMFVIGNSALSMLLFRLFHNGTLASTVSMTVFVCTVILVLRLKHGGQTYSLERIGYSFKDLPKHFVWGFAAFLIELPAGLVIGLACNKLLKGLPSGHHQATDVLTMSSSLFAILATLVLGVLFAAFWEEVLFRGVLFPAISKALGGPWIGALVSSFMFAAIHPQGIMLWAPLAWVGGVSCYVSRYSGSLVPSFFLHALHNLTLMGIALLMR